jgi:hypothetical protein
MKKIYTFRGIKSENEPSEPKNGIWGQKSVWSCDISIDQEFNIDEENLFFKSPKTEFGAQNQYGRVIYPSNGNFT